MNETKSPQTLLEKAQQLHVRKSQVRSYVTEEEVELAVAVISGRVSNTQALRALGWPENQTQRILNWLVTTLKRGHQEGLLTIQVKEPR